MSEVGEPAVPREPDGVKWLDADHLVVANEGELPSSFVAGTSVDPGYVMFQVNL